MVIATTQHLHDTGGHLRGTDKGAESDGRRKLKTARVAREVTDGCLQFWGGQGFMWENPIARLYRDHDMLLDGAGAIDFGEMIMRAIKLKLAAI